jgi:hypothetical protein
MNADNILPKDRSTPGAHNPEGGHLMSLASLGDALSYLAHYDLNQFHGAVVGIHDRLQASIAELEGRTGPCRRW